VTVAAPAPISARPPRWPPGRPAWTASSWCGATRTARTWRWRLAAGARLWPTGDSDREGHRPTWCTAVPTSWARPGGRRSRCPGVVRRRSARSASAVAAARGGGGSSPRLAVTPALIVLAVGSGGSVAGPCSPGWPPWGWTCRCWGVSVSRPPEADRAEGPRAGPGLRPAARHAAAGRPPAGAGRPRGDRLRAGHRPRAGAGRPGAAHRGLLAGRDLRRRGLLGGDRPAARRPGRAGAALAPPAACCPPSTALAPEHDDCPQRSPMTATRQTTDPGATETGPGQPKWDRPGGPPTGGPAPELIESGFALENADASFLHRGLNLADIAHVLDLARRDIVPPEPLAPAAGAAAGGHEDTGGGVPVRPRPTASRTTRGERYLRVPGR